jgi:NitT/TauT family transport system permease protein/taurine transport system permease protein
MTTATPSAQGPRRFNARRFLEDRLVVIPIVLIIVAWTLATRYLEIPSYKLPSPAKVLEEFWRQLSSGQLLSDAWTSIWRFCYASLAGAALAIPLGVGIALNRYVAAFFQPLVVFFQAIAGIAWVPLAIVWFGFGDRTVAFVVANAVFFIVLYNTMTGVMTIPRNLRNMVRTLGGSEWEVLRHVILPGALVNILLGLRLGLSFGWRALVAAEMISAAKGLGYRALDAAQYFKSATIIVGILTIGAIWLLMDRLLLQTIEKRTVGRWGLLHRYGE